MDLKEIGINARNSLDSAQDRDYWRALVNAELNLRVPKARFSYIFYSSSCYHIPQNYQTRTSD